MSSLQFQRPPPLEYFRRWCRATSSSRCSRRRPASRRTNTRDLDVQAVLGDVDQLLARLKRRMPADAAPLQRLRTLNQFFFQDLGFAGNVNDYCDPDNSYLHVVLRTRRGIPITLAVLWIELAQGIGLHARGVCFPGHFLVKVNLPQGRGRDRSVHRPVAVARGARRSGWSRTSGAAAWSTNSRCRWACSCRRRRRATSSRACCAT